ncbi:lactonase family protein [Sinorhizobium meliloti]|uniref:lactonase family protein n=1 Tax=Rhizobium meliloti TaxID=382 RepID=UPI003D64711E
MWRGKGISVFRIDETGQRQLVAVEQTRPNPSFLTVEGTGRFLYATHGDGTEMSSFHIGEDGRLQAMGHSTSAGMNPVDVALDPTGRHLIVTNHLSGWLTVHYLLGDGRFGPLTDYAQITGRLGPHKIDQLSPKPHQAVFHAGGKRLFVVRPAWAHSCGWKSRHELVTASEVKRNCVRATERGEEAWSVNRVPMNKNRI